MTFFYVHNRVRYIREPDEIPMDDQPEPEEVDEYDANRDLDELYERQVANDLNDCITDIQGQFAALFAMHRQAS